MTTFEFFQPENAIFRSVQALMAGLVCGMLVVVIHGMLDALESKSAWVGGWAAFVLVAIGVFGISRHMEITQVARENVTAMKWLRAGADHAQVFTRAGGDEFVLSIAPGPRRLLIGSRSIVDPVPDEKADQVVLLRGQVPAFNEYVATHFPALVAAGSRLNDTIARSP